MRILHVVTMVSPDGSFGGPVRVATNQTAGLRARGHDVVIAAGHRGFGPAGGPAALDGTTTRLFPLKALSKSAGVSGLLAPALLPWAWGALPNFDLVHVHLARDLVTLPVAWLAQRRGVPVILQPHGMVIPSGHALAPGLDAVMTRRVLRSAAAVLHLTGQERAGIVTVARGDVSLRQLGNGVPWAPSAPAPPSPPEVLFCARLQHRKRPLLFVEAAHRLLSAGVDASFVLVGPDGGEGEAVAAAVADFGDSARLRWEGPLAPDQTLSRMARASIVVLPSVDEPYPMSVLEAMSVGRPVLVTESCGLAPAVREAGCGVVVEESFEALVAGILAMLSDASALDRWSRNALQAARGTFSMATVTERLELIYQGAVAGSVPF